MIGFDFEVYCPHCEVSEQWEHFEFNFENATNSGCLSKYKEIVCDECEKTFWSKVALNFELDEWNTTKKKPKELLEMPE